MELDDPALQLLETFDRVQARPHPMARVGTGADPLAATLTELQHCVGIPIVRGLRMIVDRHPYVIFFAQFVERLAGAFFRLGDNRLDAHGLGEFKRLAALADVLEERGHPVAQQLDVRLGQFLRDGLAHVGRRILVKLHRRLFGAELLAGECLNVVEAQGSGLVDGLEQGRIMKRPSLAAEATEFLALCAPGPRAGAFG